MAPRSPTATSDFLRCPVYAHLRREGWQARGLWTPNRLLGTAIGDALSEHYRGTDQAEPVLQRVILEGYKPCDAWTPETLIKLATKGYKAALADNLKAQGDVLMVDEPLPSRARPDLVQRIPGQGLVVTDTKVTMSHGIERISEYDTSHQLWHYAWEVGEVVGTPVSWVRVHQVTLTPRVSTFLHPVRVTPARVAFWLTGAERAWDDMLDYAVVPRFDSCYTKYGRCEMYEACHVLDLDHDRMDAIYERRPRAIQEVV